MSRWKQRGMAQSFWELIYKSLVQLSLHLLCNSVFLTLVYLSVSENMCLTNPQMNGDQLYLSLSGLVLEVILGHVHHELLFGKQ